MLEKHKRPCTIVCPRLTDPLEALVNHHDLVSMFSTNFTWVHVQLFILIVCLLIIAIGSMIFPSAFVKVTCYMDAYANSSFLCTTKLQNCSKKELFPLNYVLNDFEFRVNRYVLLFYI